MFLGPYPSPLKEQRKSSDGADEGSLWSPSLLGVCRLGFLARLYGLSESAEWTSDIPRGLGRRQSNRKVARFAVGSSFEEPNQVLC